jgi:hypothetical protein
MSGEGKYGRLPRPKDRSGGVSVRLGELALNPAHDKAAEWEEEGGTLRPHPKTQPEESLTDRLSRAASKLTASTPWARLLGDDKDNE